MIKKLNSSKTVISNINTSKDNQPNAVDLRIDKVFEIISDDIFILDEDKKTHRSNKQIWADKDDYFYLEKGKAYNIDLSSQIEVGAGECGVLISRSTLNRNGVFILSGLYDSGFNNTVGCVLYCFSGDCKIKHNTRICQYIIHESENDHLYNGDYNVKLP